MLKVDFEIIRQKVREGDYQISVHASKRLRRRGINLVELEQSIITGEIIESKRSGGLIGCHSEGVFLPEESLRSQV